MLIRPRSLTIAQKEEARNFGLAESETRVSFVYKHFGTTLWSVENDSCQNEPTASREKLRETLDRAARLSPNQRLLT